MKDAEYYLMMAWLVAGSLIFLIALAGLAACVIPYVLRRRAEALNDLIRLKILKQEEKFRAARWDSLPPPEDPKDEYARVPSLQERARRKTGPVHSWFSLSYCSYLVLPRALLQELPIPWQASFVDLLEGANSVFPNHDTDYTVQARDKNGRFIQDPLSNYRRPDFDAIDACRRTSVPWASDPLPEDDE